MTTYSSGLIVREEPGVPPAAQVSAEAARAAKAAADAATKARLDALKKKIENRTATATEKDEALATLLGKSVANTIASVAAVKVEELLVK